MVGNHHPRTGIEVLIRGAGSVGKNEPFHSGRGEDPDPSRDSRGIVTFDIENFGNLLNSDWGQLRQVNFPYVAPVVDVDRIETGGCPNGAASCYVYRPRAGTTGPVKPFTTVASLTSVWRIQVGFRVEF